MFYIILCQGSSCPYSVIDHLEQNSEALPSTFDAYDVVKSVHVSVHFDNSYF
jgi:hypothetical protein